VCDEGGVKFVVGVSDGGWDLSILREYICNYSFPQNLLEKQNLCAKNRTL